ncbi:hypothetical protein [Pontibacillus sp. HMF3514]|uniref:hypothetical protein n=1 Tax=Pontibacillus sp. HMF3514 TaxID=2692425 RepID=UPI00131FD295|nr:hypothetical protein [Pontibacillus sp. HMF3514]QHE52285.1 hypothetical protein GS400_09670 [Pontibacillus sp. HMF3514]
MPNYSTKVKRFLKNIKIEDSHIHYDLADHNTANFMNLLGWILIGAGVLFSIPFSVLVVSTEGFGSVFITFIICLIGSVASGSLFVGIGEIISQLQIKNELSELHLTYMRRLDKQIHREKGRPGFSPYE